ncbi:MAG: acyltransferase [Acetobacter orientalis]|uniref:LpxL/LpxP family acyltransferase n=1 Tax=Acetobacter orientalis TaxID=146474 RepID=UPI0039EA6D19
MSKQAETWLAPERGNYAVMAVMLFLARILGRKVLMRFIWPISLYYFLHDGTARRGSWVYLCRALGRRPTWLERWRHIHAYALTVLDRIFILGNKATVPPYTVRGSEAIFEALDKGKGCILLGAHVGSFDALRSVSRFASRKIRLRVLMYRRFVGAASKAIEQLDPNYENAIIHIGEPNTMLHVAEALQQGQVVAILGDRAPDMGRSMAVPVLGKDAPLPLGPLRLAAITGAPVVLFSALRCSDGHYDIRFEPFAEHIKLDGTRTQQAQILKTWLARYAAWLETLCRRDPFSWFNFYDFWKERS